MLTFTDDKSTTQIEAYTELRPERAPESSRDQAEDFEQSLARIAANPFIPYAVQLLAVWRRLRLKAARGAISVQHMKHNDTLLDQ